METKPFLPTDAAAQLGYQFAVLRLRSWPDLRNVPPTLLPDIVRICALLAVRPTGAPLIHRLLDLPRERVHEAITTLYLQGHLNETSPTAGSREGDTARPSDFGALSSSESASQTLSLLARLRKKLFTAGLQ